MPRILVGLFVAALAIGCGGPSDRASSQGPQNVLAIDRYRDALSALDQDRLEAAAGFLQEAIRIEPAYLDAYPLLASLLARTGNAKDAAALLEGAVARDPHNADSWLLLGILYERGGGSDPAHAAYGRAVAAFENARGAADVQPEFQLHAAVAAYLHGGSLPGLRVLNDYLEARDDDRAERIREAMRRSDRAFFLDWLSKPESYSPR